MKKTIFLSLCFFAISPFLFGQSTNTKTLYIIDSIPLLTDPEPWNPILSEDIADVSFITNRDSLKRLGWEGMDGIAYVFTKEYRARPDSVKRFPSLKQMVSKNGVWLLNGDPYSGRYIDYYNNGKKQNEGWLLNGKINGELKVYYNTGIQKSLTTYKDGIRYGAWMDYYKNGTLMRKDSFVDGKAVLGGQTYFLNGQRQHELKPKGVTGYDTSVAYYSTGKIKQMLVLKNGRYTPDKKQSDLNYHNTMFYHHIRAGDLKAANQTFYQIWLLDSANIDTYFKEGYLLAQEGRFAESITQFDKALAIEPLMRESLEQRGLARIRQFKFEGANIALQERKNVSLTLEDLMQLPEEEEAMVCRDLALADDLDPGVNYNNKAVPDAFVAYCRKKSEK